MNKTEKILTGILIGSILINMVFYFTLSNKIDEKFELLASGQNHITNRVSSEVSGIYHQVQEINRETVWVVSEDFEPNVEASTADGIQMDFEWSFRELADDAEVKLLYRDKGSKEWLEQQAENVGGLNYVASIELSPDKDYQYTIVSDGSMNKATDIKDIPGHLFKPAPLMPVEWGSTHENGENLLTWRFEQHSEATFPFYEVESAKALVTYADGSTDEIALEKEAHGTSSYDGRPLETWYFEVKNQDLLTIVLRVEYNNGVIHEGEIFPDEHEYYMNIEGKW